MDMAYTISVVMFLATVLSSVSFTSSSQIGFAVPVIHKASRLSPYYNVTSLSDTTFPAPLTYSNGMYLMIFHVGSSLTKRYVCFDTASDFTWIQCDPCVDCLPKDNEPFESNNSVTYSRYRCSKVLCNEAYGFLCIQSFCDFKRVYEDGSLVYGHIGMDTFHIRTTQGDFQNISNLVFGCATYDKTDLGGGLNNPAMDGLVGLGRGPTSFIEQLSIDKFSYCFPPLIRLEGYTLMKFGSSAEILGGTTPLVQIPSLKSRYYLMLEGISVGSTKIPIPDGAFNVGPDRRGGFYIDSGTSLTYLDRDVYSALMKELDRALGLRRVHGKTSPFVVCYWGTESETEKVILTFHFSGTDVNLSNIGTFTKYNDEIMCLTIVPNVVPGEASIFGALLQRDLNIGYDLSNGTISFKSTSCPIFYF